MSVPNAEDGYPNPSGLKGRKITVGISACLVGKAVRYDGCHKLDRFLIQALGKYVDFIPVCPEVEAGFGIPREPLRLVGDPGNPRLVTVYSKKDHTERMLAWAHRKVSELETKGLCGFIFKSRSPSCGKSGVEVFDEKGIPAKDGVGLFAKVFMEHFPLLPVEDEDGMREPAHRRAFLHSIFMVHQKPHPQ
jgi:uncharacterized protein YbbK (DUF523 family)